MIFINLFFALIFIFQNLLQAQSKQVFQKQEVSVDLQKTVEQGQDSDKFAQEPLITEDGEKLAQEQLITLDFEGIELKKVIEFIMDLKETSYIPNPDTASIKTSLVIPKAINMNQAFEAVITLLEKEGFSLINAGGLFKIVKKEQKFQEPIQTILKKSSSEIPDSDQTMRYLAFFRNVDISVIDPIFKQILSSNAQTIPLPSFNAIFVADKGINIKYAMRIANELDNAGGMQEVVSIIKLKESSASSVKESLDKILSKKNDNTSLVARLLSGTSDSSIDYFPSGIKIIPEDRTNTLILMGNKSSLARVEDFIINFLDKELLIDESPFHVYDCQYMDCQQLKNILVDITRNDSQTKGGVKNGMKYFGNLKIEADSYGNRIIICCEDPQDWPIILETMKSLDKLSPQVHLDTLIVEISDKTTKGLKGQIRNRSQGVPIPGVNFQTSGVFSKPVLKLSQAGSNFVSILANLVNQGIGSLEQGATFISFGPPDNIWALLQALNQQVRISIVSRPFLTLANRTEGTLSTGDRKRVPAEQFISDVSSNQNFTGYETATASTSVTYTPMINQDGLINLKIDVGIEDFVSSAGDTTTKKMTTNVTMMNGQTMVVGGFVKTKASGTENRPFFAKIPIIGNLFKSKSRDIDKSYIFLFVTASIHKPRETPGISPLTKMRLHEARTTVEESIDTKWGKDLIDNHFFNPTKEDYFHKVIDFASGRYQPNTFDIENDSLHRSNFDESKYSAKLVHAEEEKDKVERYLKENYNQNIQRINSRHLDQISDQYPEPIRLSEPADKLRKEVRNTISLARKDAEQDSTEKVTTPKQATMANNDNDKENTHSFLNMLEGSSSPFKPSKDLTAKEDAFLKYIEQTNSHPTPKNTPYHLPAKDMLAFLENGNNKTALDTKTTAKPIESDKKVVNLASNDSDQLFNFLLDKKHTKEDNHAPNSKFLDFLKEHQQTQEKPQTLAKNSPKKEVPEDIQKKEKVLEDLFGKEFKGALA